MKNILIALALASFTSAAFAGTFRKTDVGTVSWTIKSVKEKQGVVTLTRSAQEITAGNDLTDEERSVLSNIIFKHGLGQIAQSTITFVDPTIDGSPATAKAFVQEQIVKNITDLNLTLKRASVTFDSVFCSQSGGLFKKSLKCEASYTMQSIGSFEDPNL